MVSPGPGFRVSKHVSGDGILARNSPGESHSKACYGGQLLTTGTGIPEVMIPVMKTISALISQTWLDFADIGQYRQINRGGKIGA